MNALKLAGWGVAMGLALSGLAAAGTAKPRAKLVDHKTQPTAKPEPAELIPSPPQTAGMPAPRQLRVSCENGLLTISAQNAELRDVLAEIHKCTGALVEAPADASEHVAVNLGPGPAASIVAALLEGSRYNYIIVGTNNDASPIQNITVTEKPSDTEEFRPKQTAAQDDPPVQSRASMRANLTGGDEGTLDDGDAVFSDAPANPVLLAKPN